MSNNGMEAWMGLGSGDGKKRQGLFPLSQVLV